FFSREARENDYLWGRLHGADRLVDIVMSSVPFSAEDMNINIDELKQKLFQSILDAEAPYLGKSAALIDTLRVEIHTSPETSHRTNAAD
ncbi:MAG: DUF3376 domain-containing protein, partial [Parvibaculaceae bacterium]|nr:DUF3376 domain-containing protein [Parvibaculaceae bacterium]